MFKKDFEFYELVNEIKKQRELTAEEENLLNIANSARKTKIEAQKKITAKEKKTKKTIKIKSGTMCFIIIASVALGVVGKNAYDKVAPYISNFIEYNMESGTIYEKQYEYNGLELPSALNRKIVRDLNGVRVNDELPYDYNDPTNLSITEDGRKVGLLVDYYNGFDNYLQSDSGKGYYERMYEQMLRLIEMGQDPNSLECIYTFDELSKMYEKGNNMGMGEQ